MQLEASGERGISWISKHTLVDILRIIAIGNIHPYIRNRRHPYVCVILVRLTFNITRNHNLLRTENTFHTICSSGISKLRRRQIH